MYGRNVTRSAVASGAAALLLGGAIAAVRSEYSCPDYQDRHTTVVELSPGDDVRSAVYAASPGTSFVLNAGTYHVPATIQMRTADITIRSTSGNRDDVILDGNGGGTPLQAASFVNEVIAVSASRVTVANLTVRYARWHGIHTYAPAAGGIDSLLVHNVRVYDCGEQLIKVNSNGLEPPAWVDRGIIECSLIEFVDNSVMEPMSGGYYTGGIDIHGGWDWIIRGNTFRNIQRNAGSMEHAVHMWNKCRGTIIENNRFEDTYRAIGLGMKTEATTLERHYPDNAGDSPYFDHIGGMVRNNAIWNRAGIHLETGIELMNITGTEIYHNTVVSIDAPFNSIEYRWPNTRVVLKNNLTSSRIMQRDGAQAEAAGNLENASPSLFVNASQGDIHLVAGASAAIGKAVILASGKAGVDMDGQTRDAAPDIGADEYGAASIAGKVRRSLSSGHPSATRTFSMRGSMLSPAAAGRRSPRGVVVALDGTGPCVLPYGTLY